MSCLLFYVLLVFLYCIPTTALAKDKILSLDLCTDWMLARYADPSQVLALSPLIHQYPLDWIDTNLGTHDGTIEQILELKPDLVITGQYNAIILRQRLQELGIRVEILSLPENLSQVNHYVKHFQSLLKQTINNDQQLPLPPTPENNDKPRLLLLGANGIGTGRGTFENDILTSAGWTNYLQNKGYLNLDLEQLTTDPPDAILWSAPASVALSNLFAEHPALKRAIPEERWLKTASWKWRCPGPWTWDLINDLQKFLQTSLQTIR